MRDRWAGLVAMAVAGASDSVSAVFRTTILQSATPDRLRGRLQGVFIVVVAGGPRLGELLGGVVAEALGEGRTAVLGGLDRGEELILPDEAARAAYRLKLCDRPAYDQVMRRQAARLHAIDPRTEEQQ